MCPFCTIATLKEESIVGLKSIIDADPSYYLAKGVMYNANKNS